MFSKHKFILILDRFLHAAFFAKNGNGIRKGYAPFPLFENQRSLPGVKRGHRRSKTRRDRGLSRGKGRFTAAFRVALQNRRAIFFPRENLRQATAAAKGKGGGTVAFSAAT